MTDKRGYFGEDGGVELIKAVDERIKDHNNGRIAFRALFYNEERDKKEICLGADSTFHRDFCFLFLDTKNIDFTDP